MKRSALRLSSRHKPAVFKAAIGALHYTGLFKLLQPGWQGVGSILTLHHVSDQPVNAFSPNRILRITPDFLEKTICQVRQLGFEIVSLDTVYERLRDGKPNRRFIAFTLDDGYQDNYDEALPVFERLQVPFTIYISNAMPDGRAVLWWDLLEQAIAEDEHLIVDFPELSLDCPIDTLARKYAAFDAVYSYIRGIQDASSQSAQIESLVEQLDLDAEFHARSVAMGWETIRQLARHPLCTIGAHTDSHPALSRLDEAAMLREVVNARDRLQTEIDRPVEHFAYPFGDRGSAAAREFELVSRMGFRTAVTTRKGVLFPQHAEHLHALPRISLNGDFQREIYTRVFTGGGPFALSNRFRKLNVG